MPQLDKEIFIEHIFCIFTIMLYIHSDYIIVENFFRLNIRFFLLNFWKKRGLYINKETSYIKNYYNYLSFLFLKN